MSFKVKKWVGSEIKNCQRCNEVIEDVFYDANTYLGHWLILCEGCFHKFGMGLGLGLGQKYDMATLEKLEG